MKIDDVFISSENKKLNCIIYEDEHYFKFKYSGTFSHIPEELKKRTLENICIQTDVHIIFYIKKLPFYVKYYQNFKKFLSKLHTRLK